MASIIGLRRRGSALRITDAAAGSGRVVAGMTQQYLAGELSLRLAQLQAAAAGRPSAQDVAHLRREAETGPLTALAVVALRALELTDTLCWDSLTRGDSAAFTYEAAIGAELSEFAVCVSLREDDV